ncbi:phosphate/phosphite/phosphonate ABC transporter substrate-binding protein [Flexivirga caeni]|uniref:Phosphate/phosphite/phosphonate ABC transporter substrate-binding protein n=1 Tax=Flexivirga caeni TaxID=2294115 RepID=A0A3M9LXP1_9MICO|nr:phosphate/phosphite/phosphonate ABC transporter substrate-binding protein [Flexivirga caeni]RNI18066.1 phosphate/phosphite/phosphonate ABC transporter substrate-binding protein [Flexivirga caeni]
MVTPRRRLIGAATVAAASALALAGCGASSSGGNAAASGTGTHSGSGGAQGACTGSSNAKAAAPKSLTLALVPSGNANQLVQTVKPLTEALTKSLGIPVKGVITTDYQAAVEAIGANQAQIGMLPSLQMSQACERYGAVPSLQSVRAGKSSYAAQFFTDDPSKYCSDKPVKGANGMLYCNGTQSGNGPAGLSSLSKLKGAKVTLLQPASPAGYIFPVAALKAAGITIKDLKVTQVTANDAAVQSVYNGDSQVGASYWDARSVVTKSDPDVGTKVVVFALTKEIPNDGVSISSKLSPAWQAKIKKALLDYAATSAGKNALNAIYQITGLAPANPTALAETQKVANSIGVS